jgi:DNA-binding response OmpR family regulator
MNILVVEDDKANALLIEKLLKKEKYSVDIASNAKEALEFIDKALYNLIILDWNLPDGSGFEILKETRDLLIDSQILMLSANSDIAYRVKALDSGADDYLCKPYALVELLARVKSLLRRTSSNKSTNLEIENIILDKQSRVIFVDNQEINMTSAEYDIFEAMASNPNKTFTKFELLNLSNNEYGASMMSNIVEVHIKNIRKKLNNKEIIKTIRSVGYKINLSS